MIRSSENLIRLCTRAMVKADLRRTGVDTTDDWEIDRLIDNISRGAAAIMGRGVEKTERTEYFDLATGQREIWVVGSPVDTDESITVYNNTDKPRVWTQSSDLIDSDYILCDPKRAERGSILFETSLRRGEQCLKVTYTGGMAAWTGENGVDGACAASGVFTSAGSLFSTRGLVAGYKLVIESGSNAGTYTISSVDSETQITIDGTFSSTDTTGERFYILDSNDSSFVNDYEEIAEAVMYQVAYMVRNRGVQGISNESFGGASISYERPVNWLNDVLNTLHAHARGYSPMHKSRIGIYGRSSY